MKLVTFAPAGAPPRTGLIRNSWVVDLHGADSSVPSDMKQLLASWDDVAPRLEGLADACTDRSLLHRMSEVKLLPPVPSPGRYLDFYSFEGHVKNARARRGLEVPKEWYDHASYYNGNPYCFVGDGQPVAYPADETERDYEMELAVVIRRPVRDLAPADWQSAVAGFTILNDCSARARQMPYAKIGMGPSYGKDFGKALGPAIVSVDTCPDPAKIELVTRVGGEERSRGLFGQSRYDWGAMLAFATQDQELRPGDVVGSGTFPNGCGYETGRFLNVGDVVEIEMRYDGAPIMTLRNAVA